MYMKISHDYKFLIKHVPYRLRIPDFEIIETEKKKEKFIVLLILPKVFAKNMNAQVGI